MNILGISAFYHDSAAALIRDGKIIAAAQEERFSRKKHDHSFPKNCINYCLKAGGIGAKDLDFVAFYDKPFLKFERILETYLATAPKGIRSFLKAMPLWLKQKLWMKDLISRELGYTGKIIFPEHHASHAASAFYPSPFERAAFLTMDGVGEWATSSFGVGNGKGIKIIADIKFPNSLGLLYSAFTYYLGFKINDGEYKVMGLAPYGEAKYKDLILTKLLDLKEDGSFRMNQEYFNYLSGLTMTSAKFHELFGGPPKDPKSEVTKRHMDLARSIQEVVEEIVMRMARHIKKETGEDYLCLAGGVALNCVANGKLLRSRLFKDVWIQPAAGDAGGALGAAFFTWHQYLKKDRTPEPEDSMQGAYLGPSFNDAEIKKFLDENSISFEELLESKISGRIADLVAQEKVVGWFQGRMEFGPRALGSRSIIGDARSPKMQSVLNLKIKFRESFRPFAPAILAERVSDYFDLDRPSPYMLLVAVVNKKHRLKMTAEAENLFGIQKLNIARSDVPAITHVDYSARVQTVHKETNPRFYELIAAFDHKYKCPVIINTSFNLSDEPIVCRPEEAYSTFVRCEMDYLIMGRYLVSKSK
ncbi:carbamoyltransferase [Candidatus Giovannonibacteria bacterium]|nr:carbamoyltransferase [Candidatus Giovannonibacteria bacterium]